MSRPEKVAGAVALVTGANRGIGRSFVDELLKRGVSKVYAGVRDPKSFGSIPEGVEVVALDITDQSSISEVARRCSDVSVLVNNAGYHGKDYLVRCSDPAAARMEMEVNYFGTLAMIRSFADVLGRTPWSAIINVASVAGAYPAAFMGGYSPAKAAALFLTTIARAELSSQGTEVVGLVVGSVDTRMADHVEGTKETPSVIARAGLDALNRGEWTCDTDAMAIDSRARFARDPARYERQMAKLLSFEKLVTGQ